MGRFFLFLTRLYCLEMYLCVIGLSIQIRAYFSLMFKNQIYQGISFFGLLKQKRDLKHLYIVKAICGRR
jgi:hypothetical protein